MFSGRLLGSWASVLAKKAWLVTLIVGIAMVALSVMVIQASNYSDEQKAMTPIDSESRKEKDKFEAMEFPEFENMAFIYRAHNGENLLTIAHFQRVLDFHAFLLTYNNNQLRDTDCFKAASRCIYSSHLADFFQDSSGTVTFPGTISSDAALVTQVNLGVNPTLGGSVSVGNIFGVTTPSPITQDAGTGFYNYQEARAIRCGYFLKTTETFYKLYKQAAADFVA